jgi:hypothetical protein
MTKYDLELRFKELALSVYNKDKPLPVPETDTYFRFYLDAMVWQMVPRVELEAWISYYESKLVA